MTFVPNPEGLRRTLLSPQGPVGLMIVRKTEKIANQARVNATKIIPASSQFPDAIGFRFQETPEGLEGQIGATREGSIGRSLD